MKNVQACLSVRNDLKVVFTIVEVLVPRYGQARAGLFKYQERSRKQF